MEDTKVEQQQNEFTMLQKRAKNGTTVLFVLTGLAFLGGIILLGMGEEDYQSMGIGALILGVLYLSLGLWSRKKAYPALLVSSILYAAMVIFSVMTGSMNIFQIGIQALILVLLVRAALAANELRKH